MMPSQLRLGSNFVVRALIISAIIASHFAAGCGTSYTAQPSPTQAPAITSANSATFTAGMAGSFTVTATGTPTPTLTETGALPSGVTFAAATGLLSGTPAAGSGGTYPITITAHNGADATQGFTLTVDQSAAITSTSNTTFTVGAAGTFTVTATGFPAPTFTETGTLPTGVLLNMSTGVLGGTPTVSGTFPIVITAHNGVGTDATLNFTLRVNPAGQGPAITSANSATFTVGILGSFTVMATGLPVPTLNESGQLPNGVTFDPTTGLLSGTPAMGMGTIYPIMFTAHNGVGADATQSFTLTVNEAPSITSLNNTNFTVGASGTFTVTASGFPAPTLSLSATSALPNGVMFNGPTGVLSGTPATGSAASYSLTFTAHNGVGADATQSFTLTVDTPPTITSGNSTTFTVGTQGTFTVKATGSPAPLTLSETGILPNGVLFTDNGNGTATMSGIPVAGTGTIYSIIIAAQNGAGSTVTQNFTLTVDEAPSFTSLSSTTFTVNARGMFTVTAAGYPAPILSLTTGTLPNGVTFNSSTGVLSGTPAAGSAGSYPLTFTASNVVGPNATQNFTLTVNPAPPVIGDTLPTSPIFAGGNAVTIPVTVANDVATDVLTASLTVDSNTGAACTTTTCGTVGPVTPVSLGTYTLSYTPPATLTAQVVPTLVISSNLSGSFASTDYIEVDPAGVLLVKLSGGGTVQVGSAQSLTATVYNDAAGNPGVTIAPLTASGYACSTLATNSCGTLVVGAKTPSGTTTTAPITYTPPTSLPSAPYDRPRVQATSVASPAQLASTSFLISGTAPANTGLRIPTGEKFNSALAATGAAALTVDANIANDTGNIRTVTWKLTSNDSNGADCSGPCGTLSTATSTGNGTFVSSTITYTPPSSVPSGTQATPTITATSVDNSSATDSFTFTLSDGTCAKGHESVLNGQYAFLLRGGGANAGYTALIGSFDANGAGGIISGLLDANASIGPATGFTILTSGSSYTVGADNRVCLTLANSGGGVQTFRASLGTLVAGVATQGRIIRSDDNTGRRPRQSGVLMKQDPTSFNAGAFTGTYADGFVGVDQNGGRYASAGVVTANGVSTLSNMSTDYDDTVAHGNLTGGSGTYSMAASGRGIATLTIPGAPAGASTSNLVLYMVSSSEILAMTTDPASTNVIESGELKKQTGSPFAQTSLDSANYVLYATGVDPSSGGNDTVLGQTHFAASANGVGTITIDENNNGSEKPVQSGMATFQIESTGRVTIPPLSANGHQTILYLVDASSAFMVGTDTAVGSGYVERQIGTPFGTSSISGSFFFGGDAPTTGAQYQSGTASFNAPSGGTSSINGKADDSRPNGLKTDILSPTTGWTYSFSVSSTPPGKGTVGPNSIAYAISASKLVFMSTGTDPEIFVGQK
jgi:hypothetical protein